MATWLVAIASVVVSADAPLCWQYSLRYHRLQLCNQCVPVGGHVGYEKEFRYPRVELGVLYTSRELVAVVLVADGISELWVFDCVVVDGVSQCCDLV